MLVLQKKLQEHVTQPSALQILTFHMQKILVAMFKIQRFSHPRFLIDLSIT